MFRSSRHFLRGVSFRQGPSLRALLVSFLAISLSPFSAAAQWDQWGGANRDFVTREGKLSTEWGEEGPRKLWSRELGDGFSCILAEQNRLYTMYRKGDQEAVIALDADTGKTVWEHTYPAPHPEGAELEFGEGPNATPLLEDDRLFTAGFNATVTCLEKGTGKKVWSRDLMKEFDGTFLQFGYSSSPIAYRDLVIVPLGGKGHGLIALRRETGETVWKKQDFENGYGSPILIEVDGQDQLVTFTGTEVLGVDPATGELLWTFAHSEERSSAMMTPVLCNDNQLYVASPAGSRMLQLHRTEDETRVEELWFNRRVRIGHTNAVRLGNTLYVTCTSPHMLLGLDAENGALRFRRRGFTRSTLVGVGGDLLILDEDGTLMIATPGEGVEVHARTKILENPAWTAPTLVGSRLYVRDRKTIAGYEMPTSS